MPKILTALSIVAAFVVGILVKAYVLPNNPPTNDGNPIGFRLQSNVLHITPSGSAPSATALQACSKTPSCKITIDLRMPQPTSLPSPTPPSCLKPNGCFQFTGQVQLSSRDWKGAPHPDDATTTEPRYAAGTIYISDK